MIEQAGLDWSSTVGIGIPVLAAWIGGLVAFIYSKISGALKRQDEALTVQTRALDALLGEHHAVMEFMHETKPQMTDMQIATAVLTSRLDTHEKWAQQELERQLQARKAAEKDA